MDVLSKLLENINHDINTMSNINTFLSKKIEQQNQIIIKDALTCKQYCRQYNISEPTLIKRRKLGLIAFFKIGSSFYYLKKGECSNV